MPKNAQKNLYTREQDHCVCYKSYQDRFPEYPFLDMSLQKISRHPVCISVYNLLCDPDSMCRSLQRLGEYFPVYCQGLFLCNSNFQYRLLT